MDNKALRGLEQSIKEASIAPYYKGMIYGPDGVGKTIAAAQVANAIGDHTLYGMCDPGGPDSFFNHPELGWGDRIKPFKYLGLSQLEAFGTAFKEKVDLVSPYQTVIVDTASNAAVLNLDLVTDERQRLKDAKPNTDDFNFMDDMMGVYNQSTYLVRKSFLKLLMAPVNVILIAHDRMWEDKKGTKGTFIMPAFTPEIYKALSRYCSQVIYMTADLRRVADKSRPGEYVRKMQFHPYGNVVAKSHIGGLPIEKTNPDLAEIVSTWQLKGGMRAPVDESDLPPEIGNETFGIGE